MKNFAFVVILTFIIGCNSPKKFPDKMAADFKIEYHYLGGMANENRTIIIQKGECTDEGREDNGPDYKYAWTHENIADLENLYNELKKINAFGLKHQTKTEVSDRGGENVSYTINGKTYLVSNSEANFINQADADNFNKSIQLILGFTEKFRKPVADSISQTTESEQIMSLEIDSNVPDDQPQIKGGANNDNLSEMDDALKIKNKGIPTKMPNDFKIKYEMSGGISGSYRNILIQYGSSTDEGKASGESKYSRSWINKNLKDYESLYNGLYKINAFTLEYTSKGKVMDRGGEKITFTINKKDYVVSDKDSDYLKTSDKAAFKKAIGLILAYSESGK